MGGGEGWRLVERVCIVDGEEVGDHLAGEGEDGEVEEGEG